MHTTSCTLRNQLKSGGTPPDLVILKNIQIHVCSHLGGDTSADTLRGSRRTPAPSDQQRHAFHLPLNQVK